MEERAVWRGLDRKSGRLVGAAETSRMAQASAEKLELTGSAKKEGVRLMTQREQLTSTPESPLPKRTICPKYQIIR